MEPVEENGLRGRFVLCSIGSQAATQKMGMRPFNVKKQNLIGEIPITNEHIKNNQEIRRVLAKSRIYPEELPSEEDIKKLEKRIKKDSENLIENTVALPAEWDPASPGK